MLDSLVAITETAEFEDSGGFRFHSVNATPNGLLLEVFFVPGDNGHEQPWRIECTGVRTYKLLGEFSSGLQVVSEHPVLLPFIEHVTDLYFYCPAPNPLATVGALYERHRRFVSDWLPFSQFLNNLEPKGLSALLGLHSGLIASGPVSLMNAYAQVLSEHGVRSSTLERRPIKYWGENKSVIPPRTLFALLFDSSYVVAERFDGEELAV